MSEEKKELKKNLKNEELCEGKQKLSIEELENVNGGQVEESVILAQHAEKAKDEAAKMKKLQSTVITSAGTMSVMV